MTIEQAFALALQHHQAGRLADAERLYRQVLAVQPRHAGALHHLGVLAQQVGNYNVARKLIGEAVGLSPANPAALCNLAEVCRALGLLEESIATYRRALELRPDHPETYCNLGVVLTDAGRLEEAANVYRRALEITPHLAAAYNNLAVVLKRQGRWNEAILHYRRALELEPNYLDVCYNLGNALKDRGQFEEAVTVYTRALQLKPDSVEICNNLGVVLASLSRHEEAIVVYRRAIQIQPGEPRAYNNLGNALRERSQFDQAEAAFREALRIKPDYGKACSNLGNVLRDQGRLDEALAAYRRSADLQPDDPSGLSNVIYALQFHPTAVASVIADEQHRWNRQFVAPLKRSIRPHLNDRSPGRRLRIGYVSPEFRDHVTGRYLIPLFQHHDHEEFEIVCYSGALRPDALTEEFRRHADLWRNTVGLSNEALAEVIRQDGVDILADLTQHMSGSRLPVFARRPAPVQVSFAGYPASTGLETIEYRISDRYLESELGDGRLKIESELRTPNSELRRAERVCLLDSFWCYDPYGAEVAVNPLPALESGMVTFGCLNNFSKINEPLLRLWAKVLGEVRNSRLVFLIAAGSQREWVRRILQQEGIEAERMEFVEICPRRDYLKLYHRIDVVLDPFPYNGHTTSLDALWMGVPVVSLAGVAPVSRGGLGILTNIGLPELIAWSPEDYVSIASALARDLPRLAELRAALRSRMEVSSLMDARGFTRAIESAYRAMWRRWCTTEQT